MRVSSRECAFLRRIDGWVLQLLSYVAQTEREFIKRRQAEGISAAKAKGVKFGAKPKEKPAEYEGLAEAWRCGEVSARKAAEQLHVSHPTFRKNELFPKNMAKLVL